jgi:hypothetical protein
VGRVHGNGEDHANGCQHDGHASWRDARTAVERLTAT